MNKIPARVTPLWIVAAFVTMTEVVLGYAVTQVTGEIQIALTVFVIAFAVLVAGAFFFVLWSRPYVFYPPSEYGSTDPKTFVSALRSEVSEKVIEQVELVSSVERDPSNLEAQFKLIDSLLDEAHRQHLILMHECKCDLPYYDYHGNNYEIEYVNGGAASGNLDCRNFIKKLEGTGFVTLLTKGINISLTEEGRCFSLWLVEHGQKAVYMKTDFGGWGEPRADSPIFRMREKQTKSESKKTAPLNG